MRPSCGDRRAAAAISAACRDEAAVRSFLCVAAAAEGMRRIYMQRLATHRAFGGPMSAAAGAPPLAASVLTAAASSILPLAAIRASWTRVCAADKLVGACVFRLQEIPHLQSQLKTFKCCRARVATSRGHTISQESSTSVHFPWRKRGDRRFFTRRVSANEETTSSVLAAATTPATVCASPCHPLSRCAKLPREASTSFSERARLHSHATISTSAPLATAASSGASVVTPTHSSTTTTTATTAAAVVSPSLTLRYHLQQTRCLLKEQRHRHPVSRNDSRTLQGATGASGFHPDFESTRSIKATYFPAASANGRSAALSMGSSCGGSVSVARNMASSFLTTCGAFKKWRHFVVGGSSISHAATCAAIKCRCAVTRGGSAATAVCPGASTDVSCATTTSASGALSGSKAGLGTAVTAASYKSSSGVAASGIRYVGVLSYMPAEISGGFGTRDVIGGCTSLRQRQRCFVSAAVAPPRSTVAAAERPLQHQEAGLLHAVNIPPLGDSVTRGSVLQWRKKVGDPVHFDEVLCVIETDKVTVEIHSDCEGIVVAHAAAEGESLNVGSQLALIRVVNPDAEGGSFPTSEHLDEIHDQDLQHHSMRGEQAPQLTHHSQHQSLQQNLQQSQQQSQQLQRNQYLHQQQQQHPEAQARTAGNVQKYIPEATEQHSELSEKQNVDKDPDTRKEAVPPAHGDGAAAPAPQGSEMKKAVAATSESTGMPSTARGCGGNKQPHKVRSPLICFLFGKRKRQPGGGGIGSSSTGGGLGEMHEQTNNPPHASSVDTTQDEDPLLELWGVPRWRSLSEEEIEAVNLGGAGAAANDLGSWKMSVVQVQEKQSQKKPKEGAEKQRKTGGSSKERTKSRAAS